MEELRSHLEALLNENLYQIIISNPRNKEGAFKIKIRPVLVKEQLIFQETVSKDTRVYHSNYEKSEMMTKITEYMERDFKQLEAESMQGKLTVLVSKKGKMTVKFSGKKQLLPEAGVRPITVQKDIS